jgi:polysaccharide biosynthesis/export protein
VRRQVRGRRGDPRVVPVGLAVLALVAVLGAPAGAFSQEEPRPAPAGVEAPVPARDAYVIGKEDVLQISVYGEDTLSVPKVPVRPDGRISLPLLGDVMAAGETPEGLGRKLTELYKAHVRAPAVTVIVTDVKSFKVYLLGHVRTPGAQTFGRETTLLQALALAGGFTEFANTKRILVLRDDEGDVRRIEINYDRIISGQNLEMNLKLKPGDTVVVP